MKRIATSSTADGNIEFIEADKPSPARGEALIRVNAISLNRGEIAMAAGRGSRRPIGWDFAGVVEQAAADGSTPKPGTRVVGWRPAMDAWAEYVVSPGDYLAEIPEGVPDATAATLPVAGLTALAAIDRGTKLVGNRVLITGVTGGVGGFALQLARNAGAHVTAQVRREDQTGPARDLGAHEVVVTSDGRELEGHEPFQLIVDGVGGDLFGALVRSVTKGGALVSYGATGGASSGITLHPDLFGAGGQRSIYGLTLYTEVENEPSSSGLRRLLHLVTTGALVVPVSLERDWGEAQPTAKALLEREFSGKAVLHVNNT